MMSLSRSLRALLLQIRSDRRAESHEQLCFLDSCGLTPQQLESINVVDRPEISWRDVEGADVLFIGGAGAHSATQEYAFTAPLKEVVVRWVDEGRPLFGSCWGHHFLAWALGSEVVHDPPRGEVGTFSIELTAEGRRDPLFEGFEGRFLAHLGHHDRISRLAPGLVELASSDTCVNQVVRVAGKPAYGSQFHSEMNDGHMRERLLMYRDAYLTTEDPEAALDRLLGPAPEAARVLRRFLELYT